MKTLAPDTKVKINSPVLDLKQHSQMHACIELAENTITLALFTASQELVLLEELALKAGERLPETIELLISNHPFFAQPYAQVLIGMAHANYTLVPSPLFDNGAREELYKLNHKLYPGQSVAADEMVGAGSYCLYAVNEKIREMINKTFPNNHLQHKATYLAASLPGLAAKGRKTCLVNVHGENMDLLLYDQKLVFANSFSCQASEDFLYFMLAALEQNEWKPADTEIILAGGVEAGSALYHTLQKYLPRLRFAVTGKSITRKNDFIKLPDHFYFSLYNLYLCAL